MAKPGVSPRTRPPPTVAISPRPTNRVVRPAGRPRNVVGVPGTTCDSAAETALRDRRGDAGRPVVRDTGRPSGHIGPACPSASIVEAFEVVEPDTAARHRRTGVEDHRRDGVRTLLVGVMLTGRRARASGARRLSALPSVSARRNLPGYSVAGRSNPPSTGSAMDQLPRQGVHRARTGGPAGAHQVPAADAEPVERMAAGVDRE